MCKGIDEKNMLIKVTNQKEKKKKTFFTSRKLPMMYQTYYDFGLIDIIYYSHGEFRANRIMKFYWKIL